LKLEIRNSKNGMHTVRGKSGLPYSAKKASNKFEAFFYS